MGNIGKKWVNISTQLCKPYKCYEGFVEEKLQDAHNILCDIGKLDEDSFSSCENSLEQSSILKRILWC